MIAEISGNHLGSLKNCIKLVKLAKESGATAVKLQTYKAETMTLDVDNEYFKVSSDHPLWGGRSLYELYQEAHTPWEWHETLFKIAADEGLECFSSPFDVTAVDFLEKLGTPAYKIASFKL